MVEFNLWIESFILLLVFGIIILVPCAFVAFFGLKLIRELSHYPSKAPVIHMKYIVPIIVTEIFAFLGLLAFYQFFSNAYK